MYFIDILSVECLIPLIHALKEIYTLGFPFEHFYRMCASLNSSSVQTLDFYFYKAVWKCNTAYRNEEGLMDGMKTEFKLYIIVDPIFFIQVWFWRDMTRLY